MDKQLSTKIDENLDQDRTVRIESPGVSKGLGWYDPILLPRWAVYLQAGLLGLVATTFFVFGLMVGNLTSSAGAGASLNFDCRVVGSIAYRLDGALMADNGAVVFLLPVNKKPDQRLPGDLVNPVTFKALDNLALDQIHDLGGAVVRADDNGMFDVLVDGNPDGICAYHLLVVSKHTKRSDEISLTKELTAIIGTFFIPVEDVVDDWEIHSIKFVADSKRIDLPEIEF